jgi:hypothetical protein
MLPRSSASAEFTQCGQRTWGDRTIPATHTRTIHQPTTQPPNHPTNHTHFRPRSLMTSAPQISIHQPTNQLSNQPVHGPSSQPRFTRSQVCQPGITRCRAWSVSGPDIHAALQTHAHRSCAHAHVMHITSRHQISVSVSPCKPPCTLASRLCPQPLSCHALIS